jgi:hypothetical protein
MNTMNSDHRAGRPGLSSGLLAGLLLLLVAPAQAQPGDNSAEANAARDALKTQEGDVNQATLLKETLSAADKQYSLQKAGSINLTYDLSYSYIGTEALNVKFTDSTLTLFNIQTTRAHTITNTASADYGVLNNLTANVTLPLVSKFSQTNSLTGLSNGLGDLSLGVRFQPLESSRDWPSLTTSATLRLPTGRSPYTSIVGQNLATGSGNIALTLGVNTSKVLDPVALFGSLNMTVNAPARNISQVRDGVELVEVRPGTSLGFGAGFAYALSYAVSTTLSFQESVSNRTQLIFKGGAMSKTAIQTSGVFNFGLGVRFTPKTTVNFSLGLGLTNDSPDFTLGMNVPLSF